MSEKIKGRTRKRRPVWKQSRWSGFLAFLRQHTRKLITPRRIILGLILLPLAFYIFGEVFRDVVIIEPFTVPKSYEEIGLNPDAMGSRIGEALNDIEANAHTKMRKDRLTSSATESSVPDVEVPGTKLSMKTIAGFVREVFHLDPTHVRGQIVLRLESDSDLSKAQVDISLRIVQGRERNVLVRAHVPANDPKAVVQETAERILRQINPYIFAVYQADNGNRDDAFRITSEILRDPTRTKQKQYLAATYVLSGNLLEYQGQHDEAIAQYDRASKQDPRDALAHNNWGLVLDKQGEHEKAIAQFEKATTLGYAIACINWGHLLEKQGKLKEAEKKYQEASKLDPLDPSADINWGLILGKQGKHEEATKKYREAIAKCEKAVDLDPRDALAYAKWGDALENQGEYEKAIRKYDKAIELYPRDKSFYIAWGVILERQEYHDEAVQKYEKAIGVSPRDELAYFRLGAVREKQGKHDEAIQAYGTAIELNPRYASAHYNLGFLLESKGHKEANAAHQKAVETEASAAYQKAIDLETDPDELAKAYNRRGVVLYGLQDYEAAIKMYQESIQKNQRYAPVYNDLANALEKLGRHDDALLEYRMAIKLGYSDATKNLIVVLEKQAAGLDKNGKYEEAKAKRREAIDLKRQRK